MKTLVLNGSPREAGETAALLAPVLAGLTGDVHLVSAFYDGISACIDCRWCWTHDGCAVQDAMQEVYARVEDADAVVIASPINFGTLTPPLLGVKSRFQAYYQQKFDALPRRGRRKKGAILLTGGGYGGHEQALKAAKSMLTIMNAELVGTALSLQTDDHPAAQDEAALAACREIVARLNE